MKRIFAAMTVSVLYSAISWAVPLSHPPLLRSLDSPAAVPVFPAAAQGVPRAVIVEAPGAGVVDSRTLFGRLAEKAFVHVGERHDQLSHHEIQAAVLKGLYARKPGTAVGLEMVDYTRQAVLDDFISGKVSEDDFALFWRKEVDVVPKREDLGFSALMSEEEFARFWKKAWGFDYKLYQPILAYAKANGIPLIGLNAPRAVIRQVYQGGLSSLTPEQRKMLPEEVAGIHDPRYAVYVREALSGGHGGNLPPAVLKNMIEAQQAWNETMGWKAVEAAAGGAAPLLVIAGSGHLIYGAGIAESVRNRSSLSQAVVMPYPLDGEELPLAELLAALRDSDSEAIEFGDYFWLLPKE